MVYLPMAYLYGKKFVGPITPTILALREEIYDTPYGEIGWSDAANKCAKVSHIPSGPTVYYHDICPSMVGMYLMVMGLSQNSQTLTYKVLYPQNLS